ncbi:hypothetical protein SAMN05660909_00091 [Chitinophaga terrae (ex Kim and Jung 2007)]|uniref:Uncharacterized protein n=1 Tax=Chitinophaga terrae (ex Kim and Jung 2007) TaxID=408074 RepID=A0A1H3WV62_9BACT|nr:hypothetical protein SAMN05660909_00091 [Chitinophaga terrae (ex Kim and Jung 2007)]
MPCFRLFSKLLYFIFFCMKAKDPRIQFIFSYFFVNGRAVI